MKFGVTTLLISAALATVASAAPLIVHNSPKADAPVFTKRCTECTHTDDAAFGLIVGTLADHYSSIAHSHLNNLMLGIESAKVTSGCRDMLQEKAALSITVQTTIDEAKKACTPEALAPVIKATVMSDASLDIPWSKKEEIERKMTELDLMITELMLKRIQVNINAETLSKDCTEKMTNTEIVPASAEAPAPAQQPAPAPAPAEAPASVPAEAPAPAPAPAATESCTECAGPSLSNARAGIDVPASVDPKYVCKSGCHDSNDAVTVLSLRLNLKNEFTPRLDHFYGEEVPTACEEKRGSLLQGVLKVVADLNVNAKA